LRWQRHVIQIAWFFLGIAVMSFGYALVITPELGAAPWDIFHLGASQRIGLSLGLTIQLTGVAIILLNLLLGIRPTVGMVLNMLSVGPFMQAFMSLLTPPPSLPLRWLMFLSGILISGIGTALYVSADLGSGPRDGLMIGLTRKFGLSVVLVKNGLELLVVAAGWWLGGPLGVGTILFALGMGPAVQLGVSMVDWLSSVAPFKGFVHPISLRRA
jgi:uncharacterized membrane protein YczE